jgi:hypothetical protein
MGVETIRGVQFISAPWLQPKNQESQTSVTFRRIRFLLLRAADGLTYTSMPAGCCHGCCVHVRSTQPKQFSPHTITPASRGWATSLSLVRPHRPRLRYALYSVVSIAVPVLAPMSSPSFVLTAFNMWIPTRMANPKCTPDALGCIRSHSPRAQQTSIATRIGPSIFVDHKTRHLSFQCWHHFVEHVRCRGLHKVALGRNHDRHPPQRRNQHMLAEVGPTLPLGMIGNEHIEIYISRGGGARLCWTTSRV